MNASFSPNYFDIIYDDAKSTESKDLGIVVSNFFSKKLNLSDKILQFTIKQLMRNFSRLNLDISGIYEKLEKNELVSDDFREEHRIIDEVINLITELDELLMKIDYFKNKELKKEMKDTLRISYQVEVNLKKKIYKNKTPKRDEMFQALAQKSKHNLNQHI